LLVGCAGGSDAKSKSEERHQVSGPADGVWVVVVVRLDMSNALPAAEVIQLQYCRKIEAACL
jgi:hypothetical protein